MKNSLFPNAAQVFESLKPSYQNLIDEFNGFIQQIKKASPELQNILLRSESLADYESYGIAVITEQMWTQFFNKIHLDAFYVTTGKNAASFLADYRINEKTKDVACEFSHSNMDKFVRMYGSDSPAFLSQVKRDFSQFAKAEWKAHLNIDHGIVLKPSMVKTQRANGENTYSLDAEFQRLLIRLAVAVNHYTGEEFVLTGFIDQIAMESRFNDFTIRLATCVRVNIDERGCFVHAPSCLNEIFNRESLKETA